MAWVGPACLAAGKSYLQGRLGGAATPWRSLAFEGGDWLICALLTPAIFFHAHRYPLTRDALARRVPQHLLAALVLCVAWAGLGILYGSLLYGRGWSPYGMGSLSWVLTTLPFGVAVYFAVLGVERATAYLLEARERATQAARLTAQLADARLAALRAQMQPHFLLNSLNAVTVIVRDRDTATATRMLEQLGELLRRVLRSEGPQEVTLSAELEFVREYLAIEAIRFSDRLRTEFAVDPAILGAAVPEFLLQPLVENAVRHGVERRGSATVVRIEARREGDELVVSVTDEGSEPAAPAEPPGEGVGLANTRERLVTLYGERAHLRLLRTPAGASVTVHLPYRELEPARG